MIFCGRCFTENTIEVTIHIECEAMEQVGVAWYIEIRKFHDTVQSSSTSSCIAI